VLAYNLTRLMNINGRPTAPSGDEGIVVADMRPYPVAQPPTTAGSRIRSASGGKKGPKLGKMTKRGHVVEIATRQCF
jgi:hypothetical protein